MNEDEKISYEYLVNHGFTNVVFEPDGNIPPDFLINGSIAVEVRRLNQHIRTNNKNEPIERLQFKIEPKLKEIVEELDIKFPGYSVFISIKYQRPLRVTKELVNRIKVGILEHLCLNERQASFKINETLEIRLNRIEGINSHFLAIGSIIDFDAGGFVISEISKNMILAISEKGKKIEKYYSRYPTWWLILVDYIGYGISDQEAEQIRRNFDIETTFHKVILIGPRNKGFEILHNQPK